MPIELGLLSSQQDSFEQHEELSKLSNETDVFYVPTRNEFTDPGVNTVQDIAELTKRFDEDISNKHLVVTFRDIGYSLFLDSVESNPDVNDQSKRRVSGKMIVDGICIQFFGCFDHGQKTKKQSDTQIQIKGVGRVVLDEEYYRELLSIQQQSETTIKEELKEEQEKIDEPVNPPRTRQRTVKLKERAELTSSVNKPKTRSRTISENPVPKTSNTIAMSPLPSSSGAAASAPNSSVSTTRPHIHSPSHMPYPLRSPRAKHYRATSPIQSNSSSTLINKETQSCLIKNVSTIFNEHPKPIMSPSSIEPPQVPLPQVLSHSTRFGPSTNSQPTMPIQIPSTQTTGLPPTSLSQLTNLFPLTQSHSLPAYLLPTTNIAYIATPSTNPSGSPFDLTPLPASASVLFITSSPQHPSQPLHILAPIDQRSIQFAPFASSSLLMPPSIITPSGSTNPSNLYQSSMESVTNLSHKRHDNEEEKQNQRPLEANKQNTDQLPFKKRRYNSQPSRMANASNNNGGGISNKYIKE